jgi:hypothetical protein
MYDSSSTGDSMVVMGELGAFSHGFQFGLAFAELTSWLIITVEKITINSIIVCANTVLFMTGTR